jgi:hypothetical protein
MTIISILLAIIAILLALIFWRLGRVNARLVARLPTEKEENLEWRKDVTGHSEPRSEKPIPK